MRSWSLWHLCDAPPTSSCMQPRRSDSCCRRVTLGSDAHQGLGVQMERGGWPHTGSSFIQLDWFHQEGTLDH